ncbi:MAG TPA: hypothetical protein VM686_27445, partial [Polyangiaceae bacterium]|nr:hypothetical protein [Polyangiaceae bacterium]
MASVGLRGSIRFLLTLGLVPAFYILQHGGVDGFPVAEGCSGAGPYAPAPAANVLQADEAVPVSVSTEGLFITQVFGPQVTESNSTLTVEVTTLNGDAVAGATKVLKAGDQNAMVGWKANAPLEVGTKLTAKVSVTDPAGTGDEVTLEVAGAPTALSASGLSFGMWMDIGHGVGEPITCAGSGYGGCNSGAWSQTLTLPSGEEVLASVITAWTPPATTGAVAWEVHVELPDGQEPGNALPVVSFFGFSSTPEETGRVL